MARAAPTPCQHVLVGTGGLALRCELEDGHGTPHVKTLHEPPIGRDPAGDWYPTRTHLVWAQTKELADE